MSKFGKKRNTERVKFGGRIELCIIKVKVMVILLFLKETTVERDYDDYRIITELKEWSNNRGLKFSIEKTERQIYIKTHHFTKQVHSTRHCKILHFSK